MIGKVNGIEAFLVGLFGAGLVLILFSWAMTGERPGFGGLVAVGLILLVMIGSRLKAAPGGDDAR